MNDLQQFLHEELRKTARHIVKRMPAHDFEPVFGEYTQRGIWALIAGQIFEYELASANFDLWKKCGGLGPVEV